jgi:hypothetical protein
VHLIFFVDYFIPFSFPKKLINAQYMYAFGWYTKDRVHIIFLRRFRTRRLHASFAHTAQTLPKRKKMFSHVELHKHDQQFYAISSGPQGSQE